MSHGALNEHPPEALVVNLQLPSLGVERGAGNDVLHAQQRADCVAVAVVFFGRCVPRETRARTSEEESDNGGGMVRAGIVREEEKVAHL